MLKQGFQIDTRTSAIALGGFWCLTTPILEQKQRQCCRKNSVLIPARMGFQVALKGFVQVFRDFCQDANGCVHIYLTLVSCVLGQCKPCFQRRRGTGFPTESLRQMNLEKAPTSTAAIAFLNSKLLWVGRTIVGWDGVGLSMLRNITTPRKPAKSPRKNQD